MSKLSIFLALLFPLFVVQFAMGQMGSADLRRRMSLVRSFTVSESDWRFPFFSSDGDMLSVRLDGDNRTIIWDLKTGDAVFDKRLCESEGYGYSFAVSHRLIAANCTKGKAEIWNIKPTKRVAAFQTKLKEKEDGFTVIFVSPDGKTAVLDNSHAVTELWDVSAGKKIADLDGFQMPGTPTSDGIVFSPDSKYVAVSYIAIDRAFSVQIYLWDTRTGKLLHSLVDRSLETGMQRAHNCIVHRLAFTPDSTKILTASYDKTAKVWDTKTGDMIYTLRGHDHRINGLAFSPDGKLAATGSYDETMKLWDLETGRLLWTTPSHDREVWRIIFSPNSRYLMGQTDKEFYLWDIQKRTLIGKLVGSFQKVAFSPDLRYVVMKGKAKTSLDVYELKF